MSSASMKVAPPATTLPGSSSSREKNLDAGRRRLAKFRENKIAGRNKTAPVVDDKKSSAQATTGRGGSCAETLQPSGLAAAENQAKEEVRTGRDRIGSGKEAEDRATGEALPVFTLIEQPELSHFLAAGPVVLESRPFGEFEPIPPRAQHVECFLNERPTTGFVADTIIHQPQQDVASFPVGGLGEEIAGKLPSLPASSGHENSVGSLHQFAEVKVAGGDGFPTPPPEDGPLLTNKVADLHHSSQGRPNSLDRTSGLDFRAHQSLGQPLQSAPWENGYSIPAARSPVVRSPSRKGEYSSYRQWQSSAGMDDFSALEQHIEDLTQEKFSLQRGLAMANEVADQLAKEHSSLTENYNQQGKVVNQLREELTRQQAEIKAQALVIASLRSEREKAQHESMAAVERSRTLAAEVVELEERVLKLRSEGLKQERNMESMAAEKESYKKQVLSLERDRANIKSMLDAVQEEKKLLAARLQQAFKSRHVPAAEHPSPVVAIKVDACTSTGDLRPEVGTSLAAGRLESASMSGDDQPHEVSSSSVSAISTSPVPVGANLYPSAEPSCVHGVFASGLRLPPLATTIPDTHVRSIQAIDSLIVELADDKAALIRALNAESASAADLRSANAELQQKLEAQTQRLELVIAQSMAAHDGNSKNFQRLESSSAAEGDGMLGWIKWLIPSRSSASSRRRYKKL